MKKLNLLFVVYLLLFFSFCKTKKEKRHTPNLSKNVTVRYLKKVKKDSTGECHYINVVITNKNDVGVYIPFIRNSFFTATAVDNNKIYIYSDDADYTSCDTSEEIRYKGIGLIKKPIENDIEVIYNKIKNSISLREFSTQIYGIESTLEDFKYWATFFIDANSYIELHVPINDFLYDNKEINKIRIFEDNRAYMKDVLKNMKIDLKSEKDSFEISIPEYPKMIQNYHLVQFVPIKDTIIDIR